MTHRVERTVAAVVRGWVQVYTHGMASEARDIRLRELDADLWDQCQDLRADGRSSWSAGLAVLFRAARGACDDILWRLEAASASRRSESVKLGAFDILAAGFAAAQTVSVLATGRGIPGVSILISPVAMAAAVRLYLTHRDAMTAAARLGALLVIGGFACESAQTAALLAFQVWSPWTTVLAIGTGLLGFTLMSAGTPRPARSRVFIVAGFVILLPIARRLGFHFLISGA